MRSDRPILTAAEIRAAEGRAISAGATASLLMERAGAGAAEAIWRFAGPLRTLVFCGPGNNGGDGYVIARLLRERGVEVQVAALGDPTTEAAWAARKAWGGAIVPIADAAPAPILIDALFGTGLRRGLEVELAERLAALSRSSAVTVAVDLPSGVSTDDGVILSPVADYDLTVTFGALKPAHLLQPAARHMGRIVTVDIGIDTASDLRLIGRPTLGGPGPDDHKYQRGYVTVVGGEMPGASALAAWAAARAGAGYVRLLTDTFLPGLPHSVVQSRDSLGPVLRDQRVGSVLIGPGLGRSAAANSLLREALGADRPLVLDADALWLLETPEELARAAHVPILTPHAGEFERLFGQLTGSKIERAREAARRSASVILFKGSDTVIAAPDGRAAIAPPAPAWLASAGTGDVLAGVASALRAQGLEAFGAACAAAWLHGRAAELAGAALIADDLLPALTPALAECR